MEAKTIVAIILVAFIVGSLIFLKVRNKNKNNWHLRVAIKQATLFLWKENLWEAKLRLKKTGKRMNADEQFNNYTKNETD